MAGADAQAQQIFDGLWEFCLDHPSEVDGRLMDWSVPADESLDPEGNDSAFDGDADIAMALLMADRQWGSGGRFDYRGRSDAGAAGPGEVRRSARTATTRCSATGSSPTSRPTPSGQPEAPTSCPATSGPTTRPPEGPPGKRAVTAVQQVTETLQTGSAPATGLLPDFIQPDLERQPHAQAGGSRFLGGENDGALLVQRRPRPLAPRHRRPDRRRQQIENSGQTHAGLDPDRHRQQPESDQDRLPAERNPDPKRLQLLLRRPADRPGDARSTAQTFLNTGWDAVATRVEGYYEDSVTLLCLVVMSGNFQDPVQLFQDGFEIRQHQPLVDRVEFGVKSQAGRVP